MRTNQDVCLACTFLPMEKGISDWLPPLHTLLKDRGLDLLHISADPPYSSPWAHLQIPVLLREFEAMADREALPSDEGSRCLAERARAWEGKETEPLDAWLRGCAGGRTFFRKLMAHTRPACVLTWGSTLPPSILLKRAAEEYGIPVWVWERGLLPGTLMLDQTGHGACSDLNTSFLAGALQHGPPAGYLYEQARDHYLSRRRTKYVQAPTIPHDEFQERFNPSRRKLACFLGHYDHGGGLWPADHGHALLNTPQFATTADAFRALAAALRQRGDTTLLFKPHPADCHDYRPYVDDTAHRVDKVGLHDLFEHADVLVFQLSTAQFEAMFHEKPVVLLARSQIARWHGCYGLEAGLSLAEVLDRALARVGFENVLQVQRRFVEAALRHYLIRTDDTVPASHGLADLADFLRDNSIPAAPRQMLAPALHALANDCHRLPLGIGAAPAGGVRHTDTAAELDGLRRRLEESETAKSRLADTIAQLNRQAAERQQTIEQFDKLCRERQNTIDRLDQLLRARAAAPAQPEDGNTPPPTKAPEAPIQLVRAKLAKEPKKAALWDELGETLWDAKQVPEARDAFEQAVKCRPTDPLLWVKLGIARRELAMLEAAGEAFQRALELSPIHETALFQQSLTQIMRGQFEAAARTLGRLLDAKPDDVQALLLDARCQVELGDRMAARLNYLRVLRIAPQNSEAQENLSVLDGTFKR